MSYLLDKKIRRNTYFRYALFAVVILLLVVFRSPIFSGLSATAYFVFGSVLTLGNNVGEKLSNTGSYFFSKKSLLLENESLKSELNEISNRVSNYNSILDENFRIKEILGRKNVKKNMILAAILAKPNSSPYDTLIIDVGVDDGISEGQRVFALGNAPVGYVGMVYADSAKVVLFSSPGEKTEVVVGGSGTFMQMTGRGGGNFEMTLPRDFILEEGTEAVLPGITPYVVGIVETIISDPRDSFQKALLASPVNIQELKFMQVDK